MICMFDFNMNWPRVAVWNVRSVKFGSLEILLVFALISMVKSCGTDCTMFFLKMIGSSWFQIMSH